MTATRTITTATALLIGLSLVFGCHNPSALHHGLTEAEANSITLALGEHGIPTRKLPDTSDGRWTIEIDPSNRLQALQVLEHRGLPRKTPKPSDPSGLVGLIPTPGELSEERLAHTTARLEESLRAVDGVLDARVHLVDTRSPLTRQATDEVKASVLIKLKTDAALTPEQVRKLISGAVPRLTPERVHVVLTRVVEERPVITLAYIGPWLVTDEAQGPLAAALATLFVIVVLLVSLIIFMLVRNRSGESP